MVHYGAEPPWRGSEYGDYGYWRWTPPDPNDWLDGPGHWRWCEPRVRYETILKEFYLAPIVEQLNSEVMFAQLEAA
jgi:hypothetical protein